MILIDDLKRELKAWANAFQGQAPDFVGGDMKIVTRLQADFSTPLPSEIVKYLQSLIPKKEVIFEDGREGITLFGSDTLSFWVSGYSYNGVRRKVLDGWDKSWLILAEGHQGWAYLVDVVDPTTFGEVFSWVEGDFMPLQEIDGESYAVPVASSVPNFLAILLYQHLWQTSQKSRDWFVAKLNTLEPKHQQTRDWWLNLAEQ
jgi:hypothetical protein